MTLNRKFFFVIAWLQGPPPMREYLFFGCVYIEEIDLRYNQITDIGAKALGDLISKSPRLLNLNLQGNLIKSEGA